jgi:serine/threonine protein kinase
MDDWTGRNIKGYELRERIGTGGFGAVYRAYQPLIAREVAMKIILPEYASQPDFIHRFEVEAQLVARLEHLHIVPLYDYWRDFDGAYLVMRWLRGGNLREVLNSKPFDLAEAALVLDQIAAALTVAHRNHVIHRDIKPGNILIDEDGNAYLGDFGIAKDVTLPDDSDANMIVGSPDYIAPEQVYGEDVSPRTDIYSLGVVLYEIITGEHPFAAFTTNERMFKHLNDALPKVTTLPEFARDGVNAVIQKATAKLPSERYTDALSLAAAFREAVRLQRGAARLQSEPDRQRSVTIFLSSPGDVSVEMDFAQAIIEDVNRSQEFGSHFHLSIQYFDDPDDVSQRSSDSYPVKPSACDLVVVIFWSRIGTPLIVDGRAYLSGTHYEYCQACENKRNGKPRIWVYRRTEEPQIGLKDPKRHEKLKQYELLEQFFENFCDDDGRLRGAVNEYETPDDFRERFRKQLESYLRALREGPSTPPVSTQTRFSGPPYRGLLALNEADAPIFFGREREILEVMALLEQRRFVMIVGASGSGKSSLAAAGVVPRLRARTGWEIARFVPGTDPFHQLAHGLVEGISRIRSHFAESATVLADELRQNPDSLTEFLSAYLPEGTRVLLFIDQFEELFTRAEKEAGDEAIRAFSAMLRQPSPVVSVLATMRADFYDAAIPHFEQQMRGGSYDLGKPSSFALYEMIVRPTELSGIAIEAGLAQQIVEEAGNQPGALALMAYLLQEMHTLSPAELSFSDYYALGGVQGAIGTRAENVYSEIPIPDDSKEAAMRRVFRELVELTEDGNRIIATRRRVPRDRFAADPDANMLIAHFTDARLLTADRQAIEVAHEALFTRWKTLADWIAHAQDDLRLVRQYERDARDWNRRGRRAEMQPRIEQLKLLLNAAEQLQMEIADPLLIEYADLDTGRLLQELDDLETSHQRRRFIGERLGFLGDPTPGVGVKWNAQHEIFIPEIAWRDGGVEPLRLPTVEITGRVVEVEPFYMSKYPITIRQFQAFLDDADGYNNLMWWEGMSPEFQRIDPMPSRGQFPNLPREMVTWYQALAFTRWLTARCAGEKVGNFTIGENAEIRMPAEWEWQWAAQGGLQAREYPWGNGWDSRRANTFEAQLAETTIVGAYPGGAAACGVMDLAGNIWEWCLNEFSTLTIALNSPGQKVVRGGSYVYVGSFARAVVRSDDGPHFRNSNVGFRVVCARIP